MVMTKDLFKEHLFIVFCFIWVPGSFAHVVTKWEVRLIVAFVWTKKPQNIQMKCLKCCEQRQNGCIPSFYNFSYKLTRLIIYGISVTGSWHHEGVENTEEFQKIYTRTTLNLKVKRRKSLSAWTPEEKHSSIDVSDVTYMWFVVKP